MASGKGNLVIAQSGGPTVAINSSLVGVVHEALDQSAIGGIYGAQNGIRGVLEEQLLDLRRVPGETLEGLRRTPAAARGKGSSTSSACCSRAVRCSTACRSGRMSRSDICAGC